MGQVIVIGGASRAGKGILSRALSQKLGWHNFSIDPIKMALVRSVPQFPLNPNSGSESLCRQLWPFTQTLIQNLVETQCPSVVEGEVLPDQIKGEAGVLSCFLGYPNLSAEQLVARIRGNNGHPNDWTGDMDIEDLTHHAHRSIEFSRYIQETCNSLDLPFFDVSEDFTGAQNAALDYCLNRLGSV